MRRKIAGRLLNLAHQKMRLIVQHRSLQTREAFDRARSIPRARPSSSPVRRERRASSKWQSTALPGRKELSKNAAAPEHSRRASNKRPSLYRTTAWYKSISQGHTRFFSLTNFARAWANNSSEPSAFPSWLDAMASYAWHFASS